MSVGAIEFGQLIKDARLRRGLQQQDVAKALKVAPGYISSIESGKRNWPKQYVPDLARVLGLDEVDMAIAAGLISPRGDRRAADTGDPIREELLDKLGRVRLRRDRIQALEAILDRWLQFDRNASDGVQERTGGGHPYPLDDERDVPINQPS